MKSLIKIGLFFFIAVYTVSCISNNNELQTNTQKNDLTKSGHTENSDTKEAGPIIQNKNNTKQKNQQTVKSSSVSAGNTKQNTKRSSIPKFERPNISKPANKSFKLSKDSARAIMQTRAAKKWAKEFNEYTKTAKRVPNSAPIMKKLEAKPKKIGEGN